MDKCDGGSTATGDVTDIEGRQKGITRAGNVGNKYVEREREREY
jgi:hypothetical protein